MNATMSNDEQVFHYEIDVERLPDGGLIDHIVVAEDDRAAIARQYGLVSIPSLEADITVRPWRRQGVKIEGTVAARVEQTCVVTLDAFVSRLEAPFERYYLRGNAPGHTGSVMTIDPLEEEDPEALETNKIDVGQAILETLSLALDPYPRKPGAEFSWQDPAETGGEGRDSPFAVLKGLKSDN